MDKKPDFFAVYSAAHRPITNAVNQVLEQYNLSSSYWRLLRVLENGELKNFSDVTKTLNIEKPAVTKIIKKLTELNYVEIHSGVDKREKMVKLTSYGLEKMLEIRSELNPILENMLDGISYEQLENAMHVLNTIRKNIIKL